MPEFGAPARFQIEAEGLKKNPQAPLQHGDWHDCCEGGVENAFQRGGIVGFSQKAVKNAIFVPTLGNGI